MIFYAILIKIIKAESPLHHQPTRYCSTELTLNWEAGTWSFSAKLLVTSADTEDEEEEDEEEEEGSGASDLGDTGAVVELSGERNRKYQSLNSISVI